MAPSTSPKPTAAYKPPSAPARPRHDYSRPPDTGSFLTATCPRTGKPIYLPTQRRRQLKAKNKKKRLIDAESQQLWVEKYKPSIFMDLLGDQRVNRDALGWVKQWDYCVFGRRPQGETQRDKALREYKSTFGKNANEDKNNFKAKRQDDDPMLRPERKILLLSGPPGFGKTTLAHVIAKHAGYNIVEVNASDDRTGEVVSTKIKSALEMQAILRKPSEDGKGTTMYTKPNLLIIDEIDGASSSGGADSFIRQLVDMAMAPVKKEGAQAKKGSRRKERAPLLRPIICICNDAFAPVLRPLRAVAHHVQFRKVPVLHIARRLQFICQSEGLDTDLRTLSLLCDMTDGDVRSCLNTLQFIRSKSSSFDKDMLNKQQGTLGKKDMGQSLFATWDSLFSAGKSKQMYQRDRKDRYVGHMASLIDNSGDVDKVLQGCFEAYLSMKFHDESLNKLVAIGPWMDFYDNLQRRIFQNQDYTLMAYMPYVAVNYHRYFAGAVIQDHRMEYPRVDYEIFAKKKSYENLMTIFVNGIHPSQRRFLTKDQIVLTVVPRLMRIISPDMRPVNKHLIKPEEKVMLDRLVNTMLEYGLTFVQESNEEGQFTFNLEPPMEELMMFEHMARKSVLSSRYATRQMIAQEIEVERLRRRELTLGPVKKKEQPADDDPTTEAAMEGKKKKKKKERRKNKDNPCSPRFFCAAVDASVPPINYRYHEGFSNAVRKPMPMRLFL
ncbi:P-loop containing nucleoside triphosphate hydrolase protein [Gongronella butleri]|nr:P-loop containing nucleoside triphosphate hydrolase protein [Gongronella butleri]